MKEKILQLIKDSKDTFDNQLQYYYNLGIVEQLFNEREKKLAFIKEVERNNKDIRIDEIIYQCEKGFIFKQKPKNNDTWVNKFPYRVVIKDDNGNYKLNVTVCDSIDSAMVLFICNKNNTPDMVDATLKLLDIKVIEL